MNLIKTLLLSLLLITVNCPVTTAQTSTQCDAYIQTYIPQARALSIEYGIPYGIIMAVAIVESGSGTGWATRHMNNHFGIVGKNRQKKRTTRYKQYNTDAASFRHFCEVMANKSFYPRLKRNFDIEPWADAISKCGYSEKPLLWKQNVLKVIEDNHLAE